MAIDAVQRVTAWSGTKQDRNNRDGTALAKGQFAAMLRQMETGGGITDTGEGNGEETTTVTQVMSDGSVLITVYAGDRVVSQNKTHAAHPQENPTILSTQVERSLPSGMEPLADDMAASAASPAQMLNMLMQK
ncbi:MAG: hypothetical protein IJ709_12585 [Selenomonas sp.]|nr:hypothetical protein [Selenomonas sp.]